MPIFNFNELPEELQQMVAEMMGGGSREAHDRAHMAAESTLKRVQNFLDGLDNDDLFTLNLLLLTIVDDESGHVGWHYAGRLAEKLNARGLCEHHGVNHDAEALAKVEAEVKGPTGMSSGSDASAARAATTPVRVAQMMEYNVKYGEPGKPVVVCKGCGTQYPSLEDRMLRSPSDCSGCQQKAAWG